MQIDFSPLSEMFVVIIKLEKRVPRNLQYKHAQVLKQSWQGTGSTRTEK